MERQLGVAAVKGDIDEVQLLIYERVKVDSQDWEGYTALMKAARNGHVTTCAALLDAGADCDKINSIGNTALHLACLNGHDVVVHLLVNGGSDVNKRNVYGLTPSHCGASKGHVSVLVELERGGADWLVMNNEGYDVLGYAQMNKQSAAVEYIQERQGATKSVHTPPDPSIHLHQKHVQQTQLNPKLQPRNEKRNKSERLVEELLQRIENLESQRQLEMRKKNEMIETLKQAAEEKQNELMTMVKQNDKIRNELEDTKREVTDLRMQLDTIKKQAHENMQRKDIQTRQLDIENQEKDRHITKLRKQIEEQARKIESQTHKITCLSQSVSPLESRQSTRVIQMSLKTDDGNEMESISCLQRLQQEVDGLKEENLRQRTIVYYKQKAIDKLRSTVEDRQDVSNRLTLENERLTDEVMQLEEVKREVLRTLEIMERKLAIAERAIRNADAAREETEQGVMESERVLRIPAEHLICTKVRVAYWRHTPVAIKMFHAELAKSQYQRRLFEQEVFLSSRLHHPNIMTVCGVTCQQDTQLAVVMELLQASLSEVIQSSHLSDFYLTVREQIDLSRDCLSGLTYLHMLMVPVLHGDIRPTNILITSTMQAKIGDLGAARFVDCSLSAGPMSPVYVAPERLSGRTLPNTQQADVYSMGVTLCELFTGNQLPRTHRQRQLRSVSQSDLRDLCLQMTAEQPDERPETGRCLDVIADVVSMDQYTSCRPRRMVKGRLDGEHNVTLTDKPW